MSEMHSRKCLKWIRHGQTRNELLSSRFSIYSLFHPVPRIKSNRLPRWKQVKVLRLLVCKQKQIFCLERTNCAKSEKVGTGSSELRRQSGRTRRNNSVKCAVRLTVLGASKDQEHLLRRPSREAE